ncbi:MAG TPA: TlyA family RNA methyltransferase [Candidatus Limiplasma merdipullorum]|nr:TlyA family RNA methyltransferase [Clostridiales bacterium]HIR81309.1 TlyA family RNA methyltransferase [Candidatus Limiplasma merdipullorum]
MKALPKRCALRSERRACAVSDKLRVDQALVRQGLASSREKAQALIMAGQVYRREVKVLKPSEKVEEGEALTVRGHAHPFVGRGALKLDKALRVFGADVRDTVAMDIGAATGGFTDVLLQNGARHVYAIDVGYGQLDWKIRNDARVTVLERTNARYLTHAEVPCVPDITVMDVSFISVRLILPVAAELMEHRGRFYILIKPQFEAGKENVGKKGVVRDPRIHRQVVEEIAAFAPSFGYLMAQVDFSPVTGPEGNIEYIAELLPDASGAAAVTQERIAQVVEQAHATLN